MFFNDVKQWRPAWLSLVVVWLLIGPSIALARMDEAGDLGTAQTVVIGAGRSVQLQAPKGAQVHVSNGAVIRVSDLGNRIKITGKKNGSAIVKIGNSPVNVTVLSDAKFVLFDRLGESLKGKRGLDLTAEGGQIVVRGRLLRWQDWLSLRDAALSSSQEYFFRARLDSSVVREARDYFHQLMRQSSLPELRVTLDSEALAVLPSEPDDLKTRAARILKPFGFKIEQNPSSLGLEPLVRVKILVAEVRKNAMKRIGVQWPGSVEGQLLPSLSVPSPDGLTIGINALEESGLGKILASPELLCRSGKDAQFLAGGEFPIRLSRKGSLDVVWKRYGVLLKISPRADFSGRMSIGVETEVSMIDSSSIVDGVPGLLTNRIETHFDLSSSRTIALSGLIKEEWGKSSSGLPTLSSIPILGPLFSSRDYRENKSELFIFVTPEVVFPDQE